MWCIDLISRKLRTSTHRSCKEWQGLRHPTTCSASIKEWKTNIWAYRKQVVLSNLGSDLCILRADTWPCNACKLAYSFVCDWFYWPDKICGLQKSGGTHEFKIFETCSEVRLDHPSCSRRHLEVVSHEGKLILTDLGSVHGTYLTERRGILKLEAFVAVTQAEDFKIRLVCSILHLHGTMALDDMLSVFLSQVYESDTI